LTPKPRIRPGVLAIALEAKTDTEIAMLSNLITLTPGSVSLDVSSDRRFLYLHAMYIDDLEKYRESIKSSLERRVLEVSR
jgi:multicomponent Na+:H+ antiporter subunit E